MADTKKSKALIENIKTTLIDKARCVPIISKEKEGLEVLKCPDGIYILRSFAFSVVIEKDKKVEIPLD